MKKILFRAKRTDTGEWLQGYIIVAEKDAPYIIPSKSWASAPRNSHSIYSSNFYRVDPETVGQYTGLTDKNGTKIFEGDIIEFEDLGEEGWEYKEGFDFTNRARITLENYRVELTRWYSDNSAVLDDMENYYDCFIDMFKRCEVIGNIYDTPELLKGGADDE